MSLVIGVPTTSSGCQDQLALRCEHGPVACVLGTESGLSASVFEERLSGVRILVSMLVALSRKSASSGLLGRYRGDAA